MKSLDTEAKLWVSWFATENQKINERHSREEPAWSQNKSQILNSRTQLDCFSLWNNFYPRTVKNNRAICQQQWSILRETKRDLPKPKAISL